MKYILVLLLAPVLAQADLMNDRKADHEDSAEPSEAIYYRDIGERYYIEGEFGKLYTDFELRGTVLQPITGKGDQSDRIRLETTHIRGEKLPVSRTYYVKTDSAFEVGSKVVLVVREEAKLWYPEKIDDIGSSRDLSHFHKLHCVVSLHLRRIVSRTDVGEVGEPIRKKERQQVVAPDAPPATGSAGTEGPEGD